MGNRSLADRTDSDRDFKRFLKAGHRSFGSPQSWSADRRGVGGELLIADILATLVNSRPHGSVLFVGLDLGKRGEPYPHVPHDDRTPLVGFGGDVDIALFLRENQASSARHESSRRGLVQDHLVLIDSKQHSKEWLRPREFDKAAEVLDWFRKTLSHAQLLGGGSDPGSLRMSYHFAHTGTWLPRSWMRQIGGGGSDDQQVDPDYQWWNSQQDLVYESPVEVLLGQLAVLLTFANPVLREVVPNAVWDLLAPRDRSLFSPTAP